MRNSFSISYKWAMILTVMVVVLLSVGLLINKFFFYDYYLAQEKQEIHAFADSINNNYEHTEEVVKLINEFVTKKQASVKLFSENQSLEFSLNLFMKNEWQGRGNGRTNRNTINLPHGIKVDLSDEGYVFFDFEHDSITTQLLGLVYKLDNGDILLVTTPFESLNTTADIAMRFNVYIVLVLLVVAVIIVVLMAKKMTRPIIQLTAMTSKISELDFTEKFEGHSNDEIQSLGENINLMSQALEGALTDLQLVNERLLEDIKEKEKNVEMRKTLIANISHELKTPIALVMSYSEGLRENDVLDDEKKAYYLNVISGEAEHMDRLVRDLLDLTELEYDAFELDIKPLDLSSLIDEIIDRYAYLIREKQIRIQLDKEDIIDISGDKKRLEQALTNLIVNAIEYTQEEGRISISVSQEDKTRVVIKNTGSRIKEKDLDKIWTSFFKSKNKQRRIGGSGIGLSIVRAIVEKHQGKYGAYNEDDGVAFYIEI